MNFKKFLTGLVIGLLAGMILGGFVGYKWMFNHAIGANGLDPYLYEDFIEHVEEMILQKAELTPYIGEYIVCDKEFINTWKGPIIRFYSPHRRINKFDVRLMELRKLLYGAQDVRQGYMKLRRRAGEIALWIVNEYAKSGD